METKHDIVRYCENCFHDYNLKLGDRPLFGNDPVAGYCGICGMYCIYFDKQTKEELESLGVPIIKPKEE